MPAADSVAEELKLAVIAYEDKRFNQHWGVSVAGVFRAIGENWEAGKVVSGASTITMQVARMARGNRARTLVQKLLEASWATRLEARFSKGEIMDLWLANAPFGGNVVGVEAATRRYYGRSPAELSWAEAATLAVLPNSPGLIHPGRSRNSLRLKRDALLDDLVELGHLSPGEAGLAKLEPLPDAPVPLPRQADHLLERLRAQSGPGRYRSSLEANLQRRVTEMVGEHQQNLAGNQIRNVACMITEVSTGKVIAYVGNAPNIAPASAPDVDIITSPRSPGSLLKPILFALAQENGTATARQLLPDIPTSFGEFRPSNFYLDFDGAVPANEALARSLNIPFVHLLREYGIEGFHATLKDYGFNQLTAGPGHYGLSLILGGGEITMEEINGWFLGITRQQRYFYERQGMYAPLDFDSPTLLNSDNRLPLDNLERAPTALAAGATYTTLEALRELRRPDETGATLRFNSRHPVAWKTGTSFGFRDAWAVGCTPGYVVSVWAGNADGEGRPGLVGVKAAAPLLFKIFRLLNDRSNNAPRWFEPPYDELREITTCSLSGQLAGPDCPTITEWLPIAADRSNVCALHKRIFLDPSGNFRVLQQCGPGPPKAVNWFSLPTRQAYYYRRKHAGYQTTPPLHPDCGTESTGQVMEFIYPYRDGAISPGKNWLGGTEPILFELAHQKSGVTVHWHLDGEYVASTTTFHTLALYSNIGRHTITVVDDDGKEQIRKFIVK
jgi:penicillin-binding protein 1C